MGNTIRLHLQLHHILQHLPAFPEMSSSICLVVPWFWANQETFLLTAGIMSTVSARSMSQRLLRVSFSSAMANSGSLCLQEPIKIGSTGARMAGSGELLETPNGPHGGFQVDQLDCNSTSFAQFLKSSTCLGHGQLMSISTRPELTVHGEPQKTRLLSPIVSLLNPSTIVSGITSHLRTWERKLTMRCKLQLAYGSECPVNTFPPTKSGCHDVFGNVWHWCEDWFAPLPGFRVHPQYDDFSAPCFDGKHAVIMGGSFMSIGDLASIYARFHFRPHFFQHAGFRMVYQDEEVAQLQTSRLSCPGPYAGSWRGTQSINDMVMSDQLQGDQLLSATLNLHYGTAADIMPIMHTGVEADLVQYPKALKHVVDTAASLLDGMHTGRALDVGCGPGGVSFELARTFDQVVSVEMESEVVGTAKTIQESGFVTYKVPGRVGEVLTKTVQLDQSIDRSRVAFTLMDACCIPLHMGEFDVVVLSEILTFCQSPKSILGRMSGDHGLCKKGGLLIVASAEDWSETTCAKDAWLDGTELDNDFVLLHEANLPYTLLKHQRKFDLRMVCVKCYQRKLS